MAIIDLALYKNLFPLNDYKGFLEYNNWKIYV